MNSRASDFDGLADLFMSGGGARRGDASSNAGGGMFGAAAADVAGAVPRVLLVGNVPTLAGIWIAQYADQCARADGPIALIRLDGAATRGEIYRSEGRALPSDGSAWLERASAFARRWIVCLDSLTDAAVVMDAGGEIVLLSGTDETAMAAARRTIESLGTAAAARGSVLALGLALVGCSHDAADSAVQSLVEWSRGKSIGVRLTLAAHAQRVDRVESSGPVPLSVLGALDPPSAIEMVTMAMRGNPSRRSERDVPRLRIDNPRAGDVHGAEAPPPPPAPTPVAAPTPVTAPTAVAAPVVVSDAIDLSALFPELQALAFHCPDAPRVLLAVDARGLHLLAGESTAADLRVAAAWARANWALLCAAVPALAACNAITEHLLLSDAAHAVGLHRSGVLLHAAIDFDVDGRLVRRRVDLNNERNATVVR